MEDEAVFSILSKCFSPVDEEDWIVLTKATNWAYFLEGMRRIVQDDRILGTQLGAIQRAHVRCPLQEFVSSESIKALFAPPDYREKNAFAACYFAEGSPQSVIPVESLYQVKPFSDDESYQSRGAELNQSGSERFMSDRLERFDVELRQEYQVAPHHLSSELKLMAALLRLDRLSEASEFLQERFLWLTNFRLRLLKVGREALFYIGLVDVLLSTRERQSELMKTYSKNDSRIDERI